MSHPRRSLLFAGLAALLGAGSAAHAAVVINEVMYRPYNESTIGRYEFIELYNDGSQPVDLGGLLLTDSQDYVHLCAGLTPADNEGAYLIPAGTTIAAQGRFTFWHTAIPGVTDRPNNQVYANLLHFGNLVLNNDGDQVTLLNCPGGVPQVVDSIDYGALGLANGPKNVSIERYPDACGGSAADWRFSTAPAGGILIGGGYTRGGTPGDENSIPQLSPHALSASYNSQVATANQGCASCSIQVDAWDLGWTAAQSPTLYQAVTAVNELQDVSYYPWYGQQCLTLAQVESGLTASFDQLLAPLLAELGNGNETIGAYTQESTYYVAPGAQAWRHGYLLLFPQSVRVAFLQVEFSE